MRGGTRTTLAVVTGFGIGLCLGPISVLAINARDVLRSDEEWPSWSAEYALALLVTSIPAAINGAIGAGVPARSGSRDRRPVTVLPGVLHVLVGVGAVVAEPQSFIGFQWYTLVFTVVIWSAGRVGQRVGCAFLAAGSCVASKPAEPLSWPTALMANRLE